MKVAVFGATGFIGSHVAEQLHLAGNEVTCFVRQNSDVSFLESLGVNLVQVSFDSLDTIQNQIETLSPEVICNCIADTRSHVSYEERAKVEITLTTALFKMAQAAHVERFIQLSTIMVYGFDRPGTAINESHPQSPKYIYNKIAADREAALLNCESNAGTALVIVRPSNTFGKRDTSLLPNFIQSSKQGIFPVVSGGQWAFSCIDARDIGRAFQHLMQVPVSQKDIFLIKGYDTDWLSFKKALDDFWGRKTKVVNLPKAIMMVVGRILEAVYPYGSKPQLTRFDMEVMSYHALFDDAKIRATGFTPIYALQEGLEEALPPRKAKAMA